MFLTRLGFGSKIVITGDVTQIDLPTDKTSGLKDAIRVLQNVDDIAICRLTSADVVIHYDPWWNLAVQNQATDRAHRIGQTNVVTVYKLLMKGTIEENIVRLQEKKSELADQLLNGDGMNQISFSKEELLELLG